MKHAVKIKKAMDVSRTKNSNACLMSENIWNEKNILYFVPRTNFNMLTKKIHIAATKTPIDIDTINIGTSDVHNVSTNL